MDVNFTSSSGSQMPLANIVESSNIYTRFENGLQIVYAKLPVHAGIKTDTSFDILIKYPKPFISGPLIIAGSDFLGYVIKTMNVPLKPDVIAVRKTAIINNSEFEYNNKTYTSNQGFIVRMTLEDNDTSSTVKSYEIFASFAAIGRWK